MTTSPQWENSRFVGNVDAFELKGIVIDNYYFGVAAANGSIDQGGSTYLDLGYTLPLSEQLSLTAHYGLTSYDKDVANNRLGTGTVDSYADYSLAATYAISPKYSVTAAYIDVDDDGVDFFNNEQITDGSLVVTFSAKF